MSRLVLVSPDGNAVAIRSDTPDPDAWNAWGVIHAQHGGHWSASPELYGWTVVEATADVLEPPAQEELPPLPDPFGGGE